MSVTYRIDAQTGLVETLCKGHVTLDEVLAHFAELERDPALPERLDVLLDLEETTSQPRREQLVEVTQAIDRMRSNVAWGDFAIVASRDVLFGMSRMLAVFAEELFEAAQVFRTRQEAEQWLHERRTARSAAQ